MDIQDSSKATSQPEQRRCLSPILKANGHVGDSFRPLDLPIKQRLRSKLASSEPFNFVQYRKNPLDKLLGGSKSFLLDNSQIDETQLSPERPSCEQRLFVTPPKRARNEINHEFTKREYRQNKQIFSDEETTSRFESDYEVLGTLGTGCFGTVKRCRNKIDGTVYAVKIMSCDDCKNINEVKTMAALSSKECSNIVRYHHSWIENGELYMVMELCESSLRSGLEQRKKQKLFFQESELKQILQEVLAAVDNLHSRSIVHLDIKPENILKTLSGKFKLGDLGLCRSSHLTQGEQICEGDGKYMAREILNNHEQLPHLPSADIFSLGMTMFELMTLRNLPCNGQHWHALRNGEVDTHLQTYSHLYSRDLINIVRSMTHPQWSSRPSCSQLLQKRYFSGGGHLQGCSPERYFSA